MALHVLGSSIYIFICSKVGSQMHTHNNFRNVFRSPENYSFHSFMGPGN